MAGFQPHMHKVRSFLSHQYWVMRQVVPKHMQRLVSIVVLHGAGAISRAGLITFVTFFINTMQADSPRPIPGLGMVIGSKLGLLMLLSCGTFVLLLFGGWAAYRATVSTRYIGRAMHTELAMNVLDRMQQLRRLCLAPTGLTRQDIQRQIMRNATHIGIITETLIRAIQPMLYIVVFSGVALYLDFSMTILIAPVAMLLLPILYGISRQIHKSAGQFFNSQVSEYAAFIRGVIGNLDGTTVPRLLAEPPGVAFQGSEAVRSYFDGFDKNQLANDKMTFATSAFHAVFISLVIIAFGYYALNDLRPWGSMIGYLLAILLVGASVQTLSNHLANLNRLYPQLTAYIAFASNSVSGTPLQAGMAAAAPKDITISAEPSLIESRSDLTLKAGHRTYYCCGVNLSRLDAWNCIAPLGLAAPDSDVLWSHADILAGDHMPMPVSIFANLVGFERTERERERVEAVLHQFGVLDEVRAFPQGLDTMITAPVWDQMSARLKLASRLLPATLSDSFVVFIENGMFREVAPEECRSFLEAFSEKVVFVVVPAATPLFNEIAQTVIVATNGQITGIGSIRWFEGIRGTVLEKQKNIEGIVHVGHESLLV